MTKEDFVCAFCHVANGTEHTADIDGDDILITTKCAKCKSIWFEPSETEVWSCKLRYKE